ncbi:hypothetical protein BJ165DRAFT_1409670 [Panaeolus papilionaceus]|nr:hypothetical protein BJ165DRAFT_1409670 [Panaeolus papilionaceus]
MRVTNCSWRDSVFSVSKNLTTIPYKFTSREGKNGQPLDPNECWCYNQLCQHQSQVHSQIQMLYPPPPQRRLNRFDSWSKVEDSQDEESLENKQHQCHLNESKTDVSTHSRSDTENEAGGKTESETESTGDTGNKAGGREELEDDNVNVEETTQSSDGNLGGHTPDPEWHVIMQCRRQKAEARDLAHTMLA